MKAKIVESGRNHVQISFDAPCGERMTREFMRPSTDSLYGTYVHELMGNGQYRQVCDKLMTRGPTLIRRKDTPLIALIRREFQAFRRTNPDLVA